MSEGTSLRITESLAPLTPLEAHAIMSREQRDRLGAYCKHSFEEPGDWLEVRFPQGSGFAVMVYGDVRGFEAVMGRELLWEPVDRERWHATMLEARAVGFMTKAIKRLTEEQ